MHDNFYSVMYNQSGTIQPFYLFGEAKQSHAAKNPSEISYNKKDVVIFNRKYYNEKNKPIVEGTCKKCTGLISESNFNVFVAKLKDPVSNYDPYYYNRIKLYKSLVQDMTQRLSNSKMCTMSLKSFYERQSVFKFNDDLKSLISNELLYDNILQKFAKYNDWEYESNVSYIININLDDILFNNLNYIRHKSDYIKIASKLKASYQTKHAELYYDTFKRIEDYFNAEILLSESLKSFYAEMFKIVQDFHVHRGSIQTAHNNVLDANAMIDSIRNIDLNCIDEFALLYERTEEHLDNVYLFGDKLPFKIFSADIYIRKDEYQFCLIYVFENRIGVVIDPNTENHTDLNANRLVLQVKYCNDEQAELLQILADQNSDRDSFKSTMLNISLHKANTSVKKLFFNDPLEYKHRHSRFIQCLSNNNLDESDADSKLKNCLFRFSNSKKAKEFFNLVDFLSNYKEKNLWKSFSDLNKAETVLTAAETHKIAGDDSKTAQPPQSESLLGPNLLLDDFKVGDYKRPATSSVKSASTASTAVSSVKSNKTNKSMRSVKSASSSRHSNTKSKSTASSATCSEGAIASSCSSAGSEATSSFSYHNCRTNNSNNSRNSSILNQAPAGLNDLLSIVIPESDLEPEPAPITQYASSLLMPAPRLAPVALKAPGIKETIEQLRQERPDVAKFADFLNKTKTKMPHLGLRHLPVSLSGAKDLTKLREYELNVPTRDPDYSSLARRKHYNSPNFESNLRRKSYAASYTPPRTPPPPPPPPSFFPTPPKPARNQIISIVPIDYESEPVENQVKTMPQVRYTEITTLTVTQQQQQKTKTKKIKKHGVDEDSKSKRSLTLPLSPIILSCSDQKAPSVDNYYYGQPIEDFSTSTPQIPLVTSSRQEKTKKKNLFKSISRRSLSCLFGNTNTQRNG